MGNTIHPQHPLHSWKPPVSYGEGEPLLNHVNPHDANHPLRRHYRTTYSPTAAELKGSKGTFAHGVPASILYAIAPFLRASIPVEEARKHWMICNFRFMHSKPDKCVDEAVSYIELVNKAAEIPFDKCPKETIAAARCADIYKVDHRITPRCVVEQKDWEACMANHFPEVPLPVPQPGDDGWEPAWYPTRIPELMIRM
eukprot:NODE_1912_length_699_cov_78.972028_g1862_i0.p1 GENE.NODE_1912_length_699_cov_78.972028_g1862_i0~~NODE_1912_length_699_cov_78.972028_g1862_i0.p1  ORF type:complete len:198 (-),score=19.95 NODE_1912_length_699_cov_78.972028_g1862_i0:18-611(-)